MTTKNFFTVEGIVCLLFGLGFLLAPNIITALYDETKLGLNPLGDLYARTFGALLAAASVSNFILRDAPPSIGRRAWIVFATIGNVLLAILNIKAIMQGVQNSMGWSSVLLVVLLAFWGGSLLSKEKELALE